MIGNPVAPDYQFDWSENNSISRLWREGSKLGVHPVAPVALAYYHSWFGQSPSFC